jgi:hypothetical protein
MEQPTVKAHKITKPFQLLAVCGLALVAVVAGFLCAAHRLDKPAWVCPFLVVSAVAVTAGFLLLVFLLLTRFRAQLQDDPYFAEYQKRQEVFFDGFEAENMQVQAPEAEEGVWRDPTWLEVEERRKQEYREKRGLFLVHSWLPSRTPGQVADIVITLHQHNEGPLDCGTVKSVEYHLGPMFSDHPVVKSDPNDRFRLDVAAYGPMLCLARVNFSDGHPPVELERYINF